MRIISINQNCFKECDNIQYSGCCFFVLSMDLFCARLLGPNRNLLYVHKTRRRFFLAYFIWFLPSSRSLNSMPLGTYAEPRARPSAEAVFAPLPEDPSEPTQSRTLTPLSPPSSPRAGRGTWRNGCRFLHVDWFANSCGFIGLVYRLSSVWNVCWFVLLLPFCCHIVPFSWFTVVNHVVLFVFLRGVVECECMWMSVNIILNTIQIL